MPTSMQTNQPYGLTHFSASSADRCGAAFAVTALAVATPPASMTATPIAAARVAREFRITASRGLLFLADRTPSGPPERYLEAWRGRAGHRRVRERAA